MSAVVCWYIFNNWLFGEMPIHIVYRFYHGPFQTNNMLSLNVELETDVCNWLLFTGSNQV